MRPSLIERAYELAKSGQFSTVDKLIRGLKREGYSSVEEHMRGGTTLRRDLRVICRTAWIEVGNEPAPHGQR